MRNIFKIAGIKIENLGVEIGEIQVESEYSLSEVTGLTKLIREVVRELPEIVEEIGTVVKTIEKVDEEIDIMTDESVARWTERQDRKEEERQARFAKKIADSFKKFEEEARENQEN